MTIVGVIEAAVTYSLGFAFVPWPNRHRSIGFFRNQEALPQVKKGEACAA
jgi:hypothetical protein